MARVMVTLRLDPEQATLEEVHRLLGLAADEVDPAKPDLSAYTHFKGSGVYPADGGTSAACPVAAGVVAAVREKYPSSVLSPAELRALLFKTAEDLGGTGFDHDFGWGVIDAQRLAAALAGVRRSSRGRSRSRR